MAAKPDSSEKTHEGWMVRRSCRGVGRTNCHGKCFLSMDGKCYRRLLDRLVLNGNFQRELLSLSHLKYQRVASRFYHNWLLENHGMVTNVDVGNPLLFSQ